MERDDDGRTDGRTYVVAHAKHWTTMASSSPRTSNRRARGPAARRRGGGGAAIIELAPAREPEERRQLGRAARERGERGRRGEERAARHGVVAVDAPRDRAELALLLVNQVARVLRRGMSDVLRSSELDIIACALPRRSDRLIHTSISFYISQQQPHCGRWPTTKA